MKPTSRVFARFESKGKPQFNQDFEGEIREYILAHARWVLDSYMGTSLSVTVARSEAELRVALARKAADSKPDEPKTPEDFMAILEQEMAQHNLALDPKSDSED